MIQRKCGMCLNTSNKIIITIEKNDDGYTIYDDTQTFIDFIYLEDKELVNKIVTSILKDRLNGNQSPSFW